MSPNEDLTPGEEIVAVADCFLPRSGEAAAKGRARRREVGKIQDYGEMFEKAKLDAVFVETTWHGRVLIHHAPPCRPVWTSTARSR